jgi:hypothetical protein
MGAVNRRTCLLAVAATVAGPAASCSGSCSGSGSGSAANPGHTYYLDPAGSDDADGRSPGAAWRSLDRVRSTVLAPGDTLLLRGGAQFTGMLYLQDTDAGKAAAPVAIGSFGSGRATITSTAMPAVYVHNTAGVEIRDLVIVGGPAAFAQSGGIVCYNDLADGRTLDYITVSNVEVSGFKNGLEVGAAETGFSNVTISSSIFHDNMEAGLAVYGPALQPDLPRYAHENVTVSSVEAYSNAGDPSNTVSNTGNGIVLGSVRTGLIEHSTAYENGWLCSTPQGPAGIWTYDSTAVVIQSNVAHNNRTGGPADGDGFDLDQNTSDCVLQNNVAYDNDGAGLMLYADTAGTYNRNNIVRNNTSSGSPGNSGWYGGITVFGQVTGAQIYGNTVSVSATGAGRPPAVRLQGQLSDVVIRDNKLVSTGAGPVIAAEDGADPDAYLQGGNQMIGP